MTTQDARAVLDPRRTGWSTRARELARTAAEPVVTLARTHTTVSVERATLRLAGLGGADAERVPVGQPPRGRRPRRRSASSTASACPSGTPCAADEAPDLLTLAQKAAVGSVSFRIPEGRAARTATSGARAAVGDGPAADRRRPARRASAWSSGSATRRRRPWIYLIVATGDIYEDIPQAQAAARAGADVIAVIRSTGQSLLDYVPEGATREGYAGTYATQENFRLMRAALDDVSRSSAATSG